MPPEPGPQGGGGGRVFRSLLRAPGGFVGHAADHRAADAQVGQFAAVQLVQLADGLAVQRPACEVVAHASDQGANAAFADVVAGSAVVQVKNSHFIHSCVSVSFGMSVALLGPTCAFRRSRTIAGGAMLLCRNRMAFWEPVSKPLITLDFYRTLATVPAKPR